MRLRLRLAPLFAAAGLLIGNVLAAEPDPAGQPAQEEPAAFGDRSGSTAERAGSTAAPLGANDFGAGNVNILQIMRPVFCRPRTR